VTIVLPITTEVQNECNENLFSSVKLNGCIRMTSSFLLHDELTVLHRLCFGTLSFCKNLSS